MKKAIYVLATALVCTGGASFARVSQRAATQQIAFTQTATPQTAANKDPLATAKQLYGAGEWAAAEYEFEKAAEALASGTSSFAPASGTALAASAAGTRSATALAEAGIFAAFCAARLEKPDAGARLEALLLKYPASPYAGEIKFRAGVFRYDAGDYASALEMFERLNPRRLARSDRDEYFFKTGHALFACGDTENARAELADVSPGSEYRPHADYLLAYMDYAAGNLAAAKPKFTALATHPSYETLIPYYLLQIEYLEGNDAHVVRHAPALIANAAPPRRAELSGMAAQSHFRLGDYSGALALMDDFRSLGGAMTRDENYLTGYSLYMEGRTGEAAGYLARATGADDALSQNASYHLADIYLREGDKSRALQSFSIAASSGHNPAITEDALFNYGKLLFETGSGRFNESINVLNRYLSAYPGSTRVPEAREYLIAAYYNSHDYEAALNAILQHPDPDNDTKAALQKITYFRALEKWQAGDAAEALKLLNTSSRYRYNTKYTALAQFWQGEILYTQGNYTAAIPRLEEYLRLSPTTEAENALARYDLGYAYFNLKEWIASMSRFDDFLDRRPARDSYRADALNREGDIRHAERAYWQAIEKYDEAAAVGTPQRYYSAYQRALMLGLAGRTDRKTESLQAIIASNEGPYVENAAYELGRTYISTGRYADGAKTLAGFIARYPQSHLYLAALSDLGLAHLNMGDRGESMRYYKMIVERSPYSREAQDAMAGIRGLYVDAGDVDGYFAYARGAQVPTDVGEMQRDSLTFAAAERVYLSGDASKALPALENYVKGDARGQYIPTALGYLSRLYSGAGRHADAADAYLRFASLSTDPAARSRALEGWVASTIATGDDPLILAMADRVASMSATPSETTSASRGTVPAASETSLGDVPETARLDAAFAKAGILRREGRQDEAVAIYTMLAIDPLTARGAESAYRVIEHLYTAGDYERAEQAVFALSQSNTPHGYWLGEAFLTLGDIYVHEGDTFQARATYQSIVDGYSPPEDGIVAAAKERIANLK